LKLLDDQKKINFFERTSHEIYYDERAHYHFNFYD